MTPIAFIGLGIMGLPMAGHLLATGYPLTVNTRTKEKAGPLLQLGATAHEAPTEVGGGIVVATVKDPWGNPFGIIHNPHFKLP